MRHLYTFPFTICIFLLAQMAIAQQPMTVPLTENLALKKSGNIHASGVNIYKVYVKTQSVKKWCVPDDFSFQPIDSIWKVECAPIDTIATVEDTCITIDASSIASRLRDTFCFTARTVMGKEIYFQLDILVNQPYKLPFTEDFSKNKVYPDVFKWQDRDVYINNTLSQSPPSIGIATFDGLDPSGNPYGGGFGKSDMLTSNLIDLGDQLQPYIRFWYQPRGLGFEGFPQERDSLKLQFKDKTGNWNTVWSEGGIGFEETPEFKSVSLPILPAYLHEDFQFRFVNYSGNTGMLSFWHLDYIRLTSSETSEDGIQDIAFTRPVQYLLTPYKAMPYVHFKGNEEKYVREKISIYLFNHFDSEQVADPSNYYVNSIIKGQEVEIIVETLLEVKPVVDENQRNLSPGRHAYQNEMKLRNSDLIPALKSLDLNPEDELQLSTEMTFSNSEELSELNSNNFSRVVSNLTDYYAYDDGTAEVGLHIPASSTFPTVVQTYEIEKTDTMKAVRFHFPHIQPNVTNQRFRIVVYTGELTADSEPIYQETMDRAIFASTYYDTLSGFTTITFEEGDEKIGLEIPKGKVHVGWQQISSNTDYGVYIGFDKNSPEATKNIFYNNDGQSWQQMDPDGGVLGALMIRPVFGNEEQFQTSVQQATPLKTLHLYPNPTNQYINIQSEHLIKFHGTIHLVSMKGQKVKVVDYQDRIYIGDLPSGKYILYLQSDRGEVSHSGSFIIAH